MPGGFVSADKVINIRQLVTQIATIEDTNYPMVDHGAPANALHVPVRADYKRHELVGLNVFVESMFNQFDPILGVAQSDFMTSATERQHRGDGQHGPPGPRGDGGPRRQRWSTPPSTARSSRRSP